MESEHTLYLPDGSSLGLPMAFRLIPACPEGFLMGSRGYENREEPRHRVVIPAPFYLGTFPVTQAQFACFRPEHQNGFPGNPEHPAEQLNWPDAHDFLEWLGQSARNLPEKWQPRLPWEAEWEYACRAVTETEYWRGDGEAALRAVGWFAENSESQTHVVGEKNAPNLWGLHDLHGNVWEWCEDVYDVHAYAKRPDGWTAAEWTRDDAGEDAQFWESDDQKREHPIRVLRGGSWVYAAGGCRSAFRFGGLPRNRFGFQGFRVLLSLPGPAEPCSQRGGGGAERAGGRDDRPGERSAGAGPLDRDLDTLHKPRGKLA